MYKEKGGINKIREVFSFSVITATVEKKLDCTRALLNIELVAEAGRKIGRERAS